MPRATAPRRRAATHLQSLAPGIPLLRSTCGGDAGVEAAGFELCASDDDCIASFEDHCGNGDKAYGITRAAESAFSFCHPLLPCAVGTGTGSGLLVEDGHIADDFASVAVRCEKTTGCIGRCMAYLP